MGRGQKSQFFHKGKLRLEGFIVKEDEIAIATNFRVEKT